MSVQIDQTEAAGFPTTKMARTRGRPPLHIRLRESILRDLAKADLSPGQRYGTEDELADRFRVSRNTVRKAVSELEEDGFLTRRRRIGTIAGNRPPIDRIGQPAEAPPASSTASRRRALVILPEWDDSLEGRYASQLLGALVSPDLSPPLALEIRHPDDPIAPEEAAGAVIVAIDPRGRAVSQLQHLAQRGARIIAFGPQSLWPDFMLIGDSRREDTRQMIRRLYGMGHRTVGLINEDISHLAFKNTLLGYLDAHRELGKDIPAPALIQFERGGGYDAQPDVRNITAWICAFIGAVPLVARQCKANGLSIPRDVSIVTLDDPGDSIIPELGIPLTGVRADFAETARRIHSLINHWPDSLPQNMVNVPARWMDRGSTAPPTP